MTLLGDTRPKDERRDTLAMRPLATAMGTFAGDLRGDFRGDFLRLGGGLGGEVVLAMGVGGSSASISWTCQERFSSRKLMRSACGTEE
jgi:hypothetical protein